MEYWLMLNGERLGPMSASDVGRLPVSPSTPVWRNGMADWGTLGEMPEFSHLFEPRQQPFQAAEARQQPSYAAGPERAMSQLDNAQCPPTRMGWSIAVTLLCCLPLGILGIIFSSKVTPAWYAGDRAKAIRNSQRAEWCIILSIVLGLLWFPLSMIFSWQNVAAFMP